MIATQVKQAWDPWCHRLRPQQLRWRSAHLIRHYPYRSTSNMKDAAKAGGAAGAAGAATGPKPT